MKRDAGAGAEERTRGTRSRSSGYLACRFEAQHIPTRNDVMLRWHTRVGEPVVRFVADTGEKGYHTTPKPLLTKQREADRTGESAAPECKSISLRVDSPCTP